MRSAVYHMHVQQQKAIARGEGGGEVEDRGEDAIELIMRGNLQV
jgi:hypothetical protein